MSSSPAQELRFIESQPAAAGGGSLAVVVGDLPLVHTAQLFPRGEDGQPLAGSDAAAQTQRILDQLAAVITAGGGRSDRIAKLNVYAAQAESIPVIESVLAQRFRAVGRPAVSYVVTRLPKNGDLVAMDAIAAAPPEVERPGAERPASGELDGRSRERDRAILPTGSRIYISGQAEQGANLAEATRLTLTSLRKTLEYLGRSDADIVQLKSFLSPMADLDQARQAMAEFFGDAPVPPTVWVEWQSPLIEIELIAWGGQQRSGPVIEFLTPPGMTASPVYSRVVRTHARQLIYVSGLCARQATDATGEVTDIFDQLGGALRQGPSDFRHLVKATYYCANSATSTKLNELRPKYYDPARPPAASKALVTGVGRPERGLTVDMIAVPAGN